MKRRKICCPLCNKITNDFYPAAYERPELCALCYERYEAHKQRDSILKDDLSRGFAHRSSEAGKLRKL